MPVPEEVREAMIAAVIENIGPVVGNPEYLARPGNVERLEARRRNAAASHVDAALSALEAAGYSPISVSLFGEVVAALRGATLQDRTRREDDILRRADAALLTASNPKEQAP